MSDHYYDAEGNEASLDQLCKLEPEWAANRIREYEHREKLHMDRCRHDMERIVALEQQNEALASRLGAAEKLLREWVDWHEDLSPTMPITRTRDFISPAEAPAVERTVTNEETQ